MAEPSFFSAQISQARRFFLDLNPPRSRALTVVCGGVEYCQKDYHVQRSDFAYYSIELVARGEGQLQLRGRTFRLAPGMIFAYGPGIKQDIRCDAEKPLVKYFVDFVGSASLSLLAEPAPEPGQVVQTSAPEDMVRLFDELIRAGLRQGPLTGRISALVLEQLLLRLAETAVPIGTIGSMAFETFQACRQYIEEHYLELTGLADAAEKCHVDRAYLCRLYQRYDHQSPYQHVLRLKMSHAAERLGNPGTLAKQIAMELGFADPFQFSRTFRRVMGISPRQFISLQRPEPARRDKSAQSDAND